MQLDAAPKKTASVMTKEARAPKMSAKAGLARLGDKIQQGFTLIELMIVVCIVGIMAAIAIPAYQRHVQEKNGTTQPGGGRDNAPNRAQREFAEDSAHNYLAGNGFKQIRLGGADPQACNQGGGSLSVKFEAVNSVNNEAVSGTVCTKTNEGSYHVFKMHASLR